jgi:hypothetical protein
MLKNSNVQMANVHHVKGSLDEDRVIEALINETINKFGKLDVLVSLFYLNLTGKSDQQCRCL